jgi:hypothetical protein
MTKNGKWNKNRLRVGRLGRGVISTGNCPGAYAALYPLPPNLDIQPMRS